jgi:hypothetical protein
MPFSPWPRPKKYFAVLVGVESWGDGNQIHPGIGQLDELFQFLAAINDTGVEGDRRF